MPATRKVALAFLTMMFLGSIASQAMAQACQERDHQERRGN